MASALAPATAAVAAEPEERLGRLIRIDSPISERVERRVQRVALEVIEQAKRLDKSAWPVLVFEIRPGASEIGKALDLARFISGPSLGGSTTVAYVPETVSGHAVLVALACDQIIMAPEAKLGPATAAGERISAGDRANYVDIASQRRAVPPAVAVALLDPEVELLLVETETDRQFVLRDELGDEPPQVAPQVIKAKGDPGQFSGTQGRELGFVTALAADRAAVAQLLGLSRDALADDPSLAVGWKPVRVQISGPITARNAEQNQKIIDEQIKGNNVNLVVVWLDSEGGLPDSAVAFANYLNSLDPALVRTVAYIPENASGDATLVALACDQVVMQSQAQLGGAGLQPVAPEDRQLIVQTAEAIARDKQRSASLAGAFFDPERRVFTYTRAGDGFVDYFTDAELALQPKPDDWRKGAEVTQPGQYLRLTGDRGEDLGVAHAVDSFEAFKKLYGLEADPVLVEPGWADTFIDALNSAAVSWLILFVGLLALYFELHSPGVGLGGFLAGLCFLLFFWSHHLNGTAGWLEILLFLAGLGCLALEVFVLPGFGVFGLGGGALIIISLVLASQTFVVPRNSEQISEMTSSLGIVVGAGIGFVVAAVMLQRFLPRTPLFSKLMLAPPTDEEADEIGEREALADWQHLVGCQGTTTTRLSPAGKARFGDALLDVMATGQYVDAGQPIVVVEVRGAHIVVQEAEPA